MRYRIALVLALTTTACANSDPQDQADVLFSVSGNNQAALAGAQLTDSLVVVAENGFGQGVAGVTVTWVAIGGGTVAPATTVTRSDGTARVARVLGATPGGYSTTATASGLNTITFTSTATVAAPAPRRPRPILVRY